MNLADFRDSLRDDAPPPHVSDELQALWYDARGDWTRAHETVQQLPTREAAWVHAYLHRKEGDLGNAAYWYRRAGRPICSLPLDSEWQEIATALLG